MSNQQTKKYIYVVHSICPSYFTSAEKAVKHTMAIGWPERCPDDNEGTRAWFSKRDEYVARAKRDLATGKTFLPGEGFWEMNKISREELS